jgi:demethylmenaquinone methyltransferase/2-methoxy-6-polyprenyl-1,4-benzoquinol methylase
MLANARTTAPLLRADALALPAPDASVDGVICGFALRNFVDLDAHFRESARTLKPGGRYVALDATVPPNPIVRAGNRVWFAGVVPLIGRALSHDHDAYRYLPRSTAYLPNRAELAQRLRDAGFTDVVVENRLFGSAVLLHGTRR